jgi:hypothetical protein
LELHEHTVVSPSQVIHSRPREARQGPPNRGIGDGKQDQSFKNMVSHKGSSVFGPPIAD